MNAKKYFWKIRVSPCKGGEYDVYYSSFVEWSLENVPGRAVRDGMLLGVFVQSIEYVVKITAEEYYEHMWE